MFGEDAGAALGKVCEDHSASDAVAHACAAQIVCNEISLNGKECQWHESDPALLPVMVQFICLLFIKMCSFSLLVFSSHYKSTS